MRPDNRFEDTDRAISLICGVHSNVPDIRRAAWLAGFDEVETAAGWTPLDEWKPYGEDGALRYVTMQVVRGEQRIREEPVRPARPGDIMGSWSLRKAAVAEAEAI